MIYQQEIKLDSHSEMGVAANYFVVTSISNPVDVIFRGGDWEVKTKIFAGFSIDFTKHGTPCVQIILEPGVNQIIEFWAGIEKVGSTAISGSIGVSAGKRIIYNPVKIVTNADYVEVFGLDLQRKLGTFSTNGTVYVNSKINGIKLQAGLHVWENGQPLLLIADTADVEVRSQDEGY